MDILSKRPDFSKFTTGPWLMPLIVVLVGVGAFGLGRLSAIKEQQKGIKIYAPEAAAVGEAARALAVPSQAPARPTLDPNQRKNFVASKNGTKYYAAGCSGAARIKAENQLWFGTVEDAEAAGYTLAANCTLP